MAATETQTATQSYVSDFEGLRTGRTSEPSWLTPLREAALSRFGELGFPTRLDEEWRFTSVAPIAEKPFAPATDGEAGVTAESLAPFTFGESVPHQLVFINGRFAPHLSTRRPLPEGVTVTSLAEAIAENADALKPHLGRYVAFERQAFVALNTAFFEDGAFVHVGRNAVVEEPIHLLFVSSGDRTISHPRVLIAAEANSQATIIESYAGVGEGVTFANGVTEIALGENARLDHYKAQRETETAFHIATMQVQLARGSNFASHSIALGGAIVRNDVNAILGGEGGECTLNGLYLANGRRIIDNHTAIDHAMPHCDSHELYKGILDDRSRGVFNGKIFVRQDAQKTDAKQTNKTLLLSNEAQINTKPQLEIYADDVKCTHGATIGQLDANALFYLRSRGIPLEEARQLLTYAFASDVVSRIKIPALREQLDAILLARVPR